jgi:hypothetical protein
MADYSDYDGNGDVELPAYDHTYDYDADGHVYSDDDSVHHSSEDISERIGVEFRPPGERWTQVRIHGHVILVSSHGRLKPYGDVFTASTEGFPYPGTPYRFYKVAGKNYYVHELVWCAFCGMPPRGYEVRHNSDYVGYRPHRTYVNRLDCLTLEPVNIHRVQFGR